MRGFSRTVGAALGLAAWWLVSCRELPAPQDGVAAISELLLPSPGLVSGDTLRDSTGMVAPLRVIAFDLRGDPLDPQPVATFVVIDSGAHIVDGAFLVGDTLGTIQVVGTVASLQTRPSQIPVTLRPDTIVAADSVVHRVTRTILPTDSALTSAPLNVIVQNLAGTTPTGVQAVIVRYTIDQAPPGNGSGPTFVLLNNNRVSSVDTTDVGGRASLVPRLRLSALPNFVSDTVLVSATSSYRGLSIGTVLFTLIYTNQ
jgi:hypothetical protein